MKLVHGEGEENKGSNKKTEKSERERLDILE